MYIIRYSLSDISSKIVTHLVLIPPYIFIYVLLSLNSVKVSTLNVCYNELVVEDSEWCGGRAREVALDGHPGGRGELLLRGVHHI